MMNSILESAVSRLAWTKAIVLVVTFMLFIASRVAADPPQYSVTVLGALGSGGSVADAINASGEIVGHSVDSAGTGAHAVSWVGTTPTDLGTLGGASSFATGVNASGEIVGFSNVSGTNHAFVTTGSGLVDLGTIDGGSASYANGINALGQVAGEAILPNDNHVAVLWNGTTPTVLGGLGGPLTGAIGINDAGQLAGISQNTNGYNQAVRWDGVTPTDLGTLGGSESYGEAINASGQVVGYSDIFGNSYVHAVLWTGTTATDLGTLPGYNTSWAYGINDLGDIVGDSGDAFLYTGGEMYDLSDLLVPGSGVTNLAIDEGGDNINDLGEIVAYGNIDGQMDALLLTPVSVPEPGSTLLFLSGGFLLGFRRTRWKRATSKERSIN